MNLRKTPRRGAGAAECAGSRKWGKQPRLEMGSSDFLRQNAKTPLSGRYLAAGVPCKLATNFEPILEAAGESFFPADDSQALPAFSMRFWVDIGANSKPPWPKPYFRGLDHLVFAGFDHQNSVLIDLRIRRAIGRLSPAMGEDVTFWKTVIFPSLLSILGPSVGVTGFHCACVAREGSGILLLGPAGSGKSTMSLAMARRGFGFLSDDWTYFTCLDGDLRAWGLNTRLKLLPEAAQFFPELSELETVVSINGERAFEIEPEVDLSVRRTRFCEPRHLVFLERETTPQFHLDRMQEAEAAARLENDLLEEAADTLRPQLDLIQCLVPSVLAAPFWGPSGNDCREAGRFVLRLAVTRPESAKRSG